VLQPGQHGVSILGRRSPSARLFRGVPFAFKEQIMVTIADYPLRYSVRTSCTRALPPVAIARLGSLSGP
jgi:hypothetical protein